jgi:hypothetical protein
MLTQSIKGQQAASFAEAKFRTKLELRQTLFDMSKLFTRTSKLLFDLSSSFLFLYDNDIAYFIHDKLILGNSSWTGLWVSDHWL